MKLDLVPIGHLFTFKVNYKISRKLFGFKDYSFYGKYKYKRKGELKNYIKDNKGVVVDRDGARKLREILNKDSIKYREHLIILDSKEARSLKILHHSKWEDILEDLKGDKDMIVTFDI